MKGSSATLPPIKPKKIKTKIKDQKTIFLNGLNLEDFE